MRALAWILLLLPMAAWGQERPGLRLPQIDEVARIELSNTSGLNWYKPEELIRLLPRFVPSAGTYASKQPFQRGSFVLKSGRRINWLANGANSILLYDGSGEQLYVLPRKSD
jgi:hypothetical protein